MTEKLTCMICDDRAEFDYRHDPPVDVTAEQQARLDAIVEEFLASRKEGSVKAA